MAYASSGYTTSTYEQQSACCPNGMHAVSGGGYASDSSGNAFSDAFDYNFNENADPCWTVAIDYEAGLSPPQWKLVTFAVCVNAT